MLFDMINLRVWFCLLVGDMEVLFVNDFYCSFLISGEKNKISESDNRDSVMLIVGWYYLYVLFCVFVSFIDSVFYVIRCLNGFIESCFLMYRKICILIISVYKSFFFVVIN